MIIPPGISLEEFEGSKKNKDSKIVLAVSRLEEYKGIQYIIMALSKLSNDIILEVVGKGPYEKSLLKIVRQLDLQNRVIFFHELTRKELLQRYSDAAVFVLLSRHEAFGISVEEALVSKTPCIVANESALSEWINGESCFGIDYPINIDDLAELIRRLMNKSIKIIKPATWDNVADKLAVLYNVT